MSSERKIILIGLAVVACVFLLFVVVPWVSQELAPQPTGAFVAIAAGDAVAATVDGRAEIASGDDCTLYAVLEARRRDGSLVYYSEAPALVVGGREIPQEAIGRWPGPAEVRVLWFTVEGARPYLEIEDASGLDRFGFHAAFRADWPRAWAIPCDLDPSSEGFAGGFEGIEVQEFGTQRYHVRIEIYGPESEIRPRLRFPSADPSVVLDVPESYPTVTATLPGALSVPSSFFGLSQFRLSRDAPDEAITRLAGWSRQRLAFTRSTVIKETLEAAGRRWETLEWSPLELAAGASWGADGVEPGDLARVGERVVVLYRDRGAPGRLDYEDLCFDYEKGPSLRPLSVVFSGDGLVEWADLS